MVRVVEYYNRVQGVRTHLTGLPEWARVVLFVAALPGIALIALSILAFLVSLAALLLLTVPLYRVLKAITVGGETETGTRPRTTEPAAPDVFDGVQSPGRRKIEVTIVEPAAAE